MFFNKNKQKNGKETADKASGDPSEHTTARSKPTLSAPRIGIALGSGLARGFSHIGVLRALERHGIEPTVVAGTSMGALVGGAYLAGRLDALEDWAHSLNRFKILSYMDFRVKSGGLIGGKKIMRLLEDNFGDLNIEDLPHPFVAITSDLVTGHEVWLRRGRLVDAMRASFAVPGIFTPVFRDNRWLIDGALVNPVPVSPCQALESRMTIAVNPNGDIIGKATHPGDSIPTVAGFDLFKDEADSKQAEKAKKIGLTRRIFKREDNAPSMFGVMVSSMNIAQDRLARSRLAGDSPDVTITPRIGHIGLMEFDRADELIEEGEAAVERALPDIKAAFAVLCTHYTDESVQ